MEGKEGEGTDVWVSGRAQGELWWWMRGRGAACVALLCFALLCVVCADRGRKVDC